MLILILILPRNWQHQLGLTHELGEADAGRPGGSGDLCNVLVSYTRPIFYFKTIKSAKLFPQPHYKVQPLEQSINPLHWQSNASQWNAELAPNDMLSGTKLTTCALRPLKAL